MPSKTDSESVVTRRKVLPGGVEATHHGRSRRTVASWEVSIGGIQVGFYRSAEGGKPPMWTPNKAGRGLGLAECHIVRDGKGGWRAARKRIERIIQADDASCRRPGTLADLYEQGRL